ncbi:MAG: methionyl-tRNA formyltransferase, partial [Planctomycetota bacterium]
MKLVFFGSGTFALQSLKALLQGPFAPALVISQPPRRRRRGAAPEPTPVSAAAGAAGLAVFTPEKVNAPESLERLRADGDALFVVAEY